MSEISLQVYEDEIDLLIEQARYVEALAHLRHLLAQFPHYVGAYYLLGKTMLEADLPDLAVDMFRRALSADPNHLLSRVGLGLAHERRNDLDAALWNLERALESEPSNGEVAEELRRMYERREGVELAYVPLTRAGLARLYLRASRYGRAAEEFRALLEEQPARPDLLTALAEAYWRNGQLVQAAELCQEILDRLPYSLRANLLLGTLWVNSGQDEGWIYLRRAQEVDPENRRAEELFESDTLLSFKELQVDRMMYDPDTIDVDQDSAWFKRLENVSVTAGISEAPPEMSAAEVRLVDITAGLESQIEIPDWLRELGGDQAQDEDAGGLGWMADIEFETLEDEAETARDESEDLVDGAESLDAAFGVEPAVTIKPPEDGEEEVPDWLQALASDTLPLDIEAPEGAPDWLRELVDDKASEEEVEPTALEETAVYDLEEWGDTEAETAVWLGESNTVVDEVVEVETAGDEDLLAWMRDEFPETATADEVEAPADELPDWLRELKAQATPEAETDESADQLEPAEAEEVPDWLAELAPAVSDEVDEEEALEEAGDLEEAAELEEELPDWLGALEAETAPVDAEEDQEPELELAEAEEMPDWLAELAPAVSGEADEEEALEEAAELEEELPDWLSALEAETAPVDAAEDQEPEPELAEAEEVPDWLAELTPAASGEVSEVEEGLTGEEALAWLERLAADYGDEATTVDEEPVQPEPPTEPTEAAVQAAEELELPEPVGIDDEPDESVAEVEPQDEKGELLSGDDALAWLESLTLGKEEELRAEAEQASADRVAEILGRKREVPSEVDGPLETLDQDAGDETLIEATEPEPLVEVEADLADQMGETTIQGVTLPDKGELLSGDDALAWLESLTIGKEEELRAEAEQASADRVAEILGRRREMPVEETVIAEVAPVDEAAPVETPEDTAVELPLEADEASAREEQAETPGEGPMPTPVGVVEVEGTPLAEEILAEPEEAVVGEDARSWLEELSPEEEATLREQIDAEEEDATAEQPPAPERFFGWSAFDGEPEEVISESDAQIPTEDHLEVIEDIEVVVDVSDEGAELLRQQPVEDTIQAPVTSQAPEIPKTTDQAAPLPETEQASPSEAKTTPTEIRPEAMPSEAAESDLDALRAYVKQKRSDHSARLRLGRELWEAGEPQEAMQHYARLIKSSAKTDDVMADLQRYAEEKPDVPGVLRTLGDAYMKFGELDKALEIFNRAMDQL